MRQKAFYIILTALFLVPAMKVKSQQPESGEILQELFYGIVDTRNNEERIQLNDSIIKIIDKYVESERVLNHRFRDLRYLGQILSPDSRLKIITWNLNLTDGTNKYFCYLIRKAKKGEPNEIFKLTGVNMDEPPSINTTYSEENWYGALYYAVQPFRYKRETYYVLLGLDYTNIQVSTKIIDVLTFTKDRGIIFGKDCFFIEGEKRFRELLKYSSDGVAILRFNNRKSIIFSHLVPVSQVRRNSPEYYIPEFSFDAYVLKKGLWRFKENFEPKMRR
jgi:hypothetical protein